MSDIIGHVERLTRPLRTKIANTLARMVVQLVADGSRMQLLQMTGLEPEEGFPEVVPDGEHFLPYGFFAVPLPGAEAVVLFPNGDRGVPLVVAVTDRRYRPTAGQGGEAGLYTDEGDEIRLARGHLIVLSTSGEIRMGSAAASVPVALQSDLAALKAVVAGWTPVSGDGGASLKLAIAAWAATGSAKVKAE